MRSVNQIDKLFLLHSSIRKKTKRHLEDNLSYKLFHTRHSTCQNKYTIEKREGTCVNAHSCPLMQEKGNERERKKENCRVHIPLSSFFLLPLCWVLLLLPDRGWFSASFTSDELTMICTLPNNISPSFQLQVYTQTVIEDKIIFRLLFAFVDTRFLAYIVKIELKYFVLSFFF